MYLVVEMIFRVDSTYPSSPIYIIVAQHAAMIAPARLPAKRRKNHTSPNDGLYHLRDIAAILAFLY
jgi:hypothetical protein